jgi:hypothetical protein
MRQVNAGRRWWRGARWGALAAALALVGDGRATGDAVLVDPVPLVGEVEWAATGESGTMLFQGTAVGSDLRGHLFAGDDQLVVTGTIAADGSIAADVSAPDGTVVATVAASRDGGAFHGTYELVAAADADEASANAAVPDVGIWEASAEGVPGE